MYTAQVRYVLLFVLFYATTNTMKYPASVLSKQREKSSSARRRRLTFVLGHLESWRTCLDGRVSARSTTVN